MLLIFSGGDGIYYGSPTIVVVVVPDPPVMDLGLAQLTMLSSVRAFITRFDTATVRRSSSLTRLADR